MRYCPLTLNGLTYHPETMRAARRLRWMTAGLILTTRCEARACGWE